MLRNIFCSFLLVTIIILPFLSCWSAEENKNVTQIEKMYQPILIADGDAKGLKVSSCKPRGWWKGISNDGKPEEQLGFIQELLVNDVNVRIKFALFQEEGEAVSAAEFHSKNMAAIFTKGLWEGAGYQVLGDSCWFSQDGLTTTLLVQSDILCALISCSGNDTETQQQVALKLASLILKKNEKLKGKLKGVNSL